AKAEDASEARKIIKSILSDADVLHLHIFWDPCCVAIANEASQRGLPYVVTSHGMLDDWCMAQSTLKKKLYLATLGRKLLRDAAAVHCTARAELEQSSKWFPRTQGEVIPYVFDLEPYRNLPGPDLAREKFPSLVTDQPRILFLSRLHVKKGVERLLQAVALLEKDGVAFQLFLAGSGEEAYVRSLERLVEQLGVQERTHFLGFVSGPEKLSLYQATDLFVLPTSQENFGFVTVESLACGTPIITTKGVDIWQELEERCGAMIVNEQPPPPPAAIAAAIRTCLERDETTTSSLSDAGRAGVLEWLHEDAIAEAYEAMYESIATSK
ncbi:MAG: glycosyltransferase, partial [Planctomycetota bacterium]|nr:glycosyltransferase [Planctomycetota bacterium]